MRLGEEGGSVAALLKNQPLFWSSHRQDAVFERNPDKPPRHAFLMRRYVMREYRHPRSIRGRRRSYQRVLEAEDFGANQNLPTIANVTDPPVVL